MADATTDTGTAGTGNDTGTAGTGNDTGTAGTGNDTGTAGTGNDTETAGTGNDNETEIVRRVVEIDAAIDELWQMISDPDELATWLADDVDLDVSPGARGRITDDGECFEVEVDEVEHGERIVWRWRPVDDDGSASSRVELVVAPGPRGGILTIIETRPATPVAASPLATAAIRWEVRTALASLRAGLRVLA